MKTYAALLMVALVVCLSCLAEPPKKAEEATDVFKSQPKGYFLTVKIMLKPKADGDAPRSEETVMTLKGVFFTDRISCFRGQTEEGFAEVGGFIQARQDVKRGLKPYLYVRARFQIDGTRWSLDTAYEQHPGRTLVLDKEAWIVTMPKPGQDETAEPKDREIMNVRLTVHEQLDPLDYGRGDFGMKDISTLRTYSKIRRAYLKGKEE